MFKRIWSMALVVSLCLSMLSTAALAAESETVAEVFSQIPTQETDLPDNDALFAGYVDQVFYDEDRLDLLSVDSSTAGSRLSGNEKLAYDALVPFIKEIAAGQRVSTIIGLGETVLASDQYGNVNTYVAHQKVTFSGTALDTHAVLLALMADFPYQMYWYDKTIGCGFITVGGLQHISFYFSVASAYAGNGNYVADTAKTGAVTTAATNAQSVVAANKNLSDYEKLVAYKEYICDAVTYNDEAAAADYTGGYGDPWQMIYVFDNNDSTNVVCEGYSKAFQYLCDQTDWNGDVQCYSVSGSMFSGGDGGGHMWNIVTLEGQNYLVDVTNSDAGSIGQSGGLFLAGAELTQRDFTVTIDGVESVKALNCYVFTISRSDVIYLYDDDMSSQWGSAVLTLATDNYDPNRPFSATLSGSKILLTNAPDDLWMLIVAYHSNDQLASVQEASVSAGEVAITVTGDKICAFFLDGNCVPLCSSLPIK